MCTSLLLFVFFCSLVGCHSTYPTTPTASIVDREEFTNDIRTVVRVTESTRHCK